LEEPLCRRCGAELSFRNAYCSCRKRLRSLSTLRSAAVYDGPLEFALQRLKYEGRRPLAAVLARLIPERIPLEGVAGTPLVAVPLHPHRETERGFNQSELLARRLRVLAGFGRLAGGTLVRVRDTPPQVGLDRLSRRRNVEGAFAWRGQNLAGAPVIVLDDVTTTGATLDACALALRRAGAGVVTGLSLARVRL
jgi:ComF family protein